MSLASLLSCSTTKPKTQETNEDTTYGYSEKNPIKVGGEANGPMNERKFLNSLSGPNGETVTFTRAGSCCHFETRNISYGLGLLDIYEVTYEGKKDTVSLYLNMYDKETVKAPVGFKFK